MGLIRIFTTYMYLTMFIGTSLIGGISGAWGSFLYLKKQSLISDVIGHASIAGVCIGFIFASVVLNMNGRSLYVMIIGASIFSTLCAIIVNWVVKNTNIQIDASMGIALSTFYGLGLVLLRIISMSSMKNRSGLNGWFFGNAATITEYDIHTILLFIIITLIIMISMWKIMKISLFDTEFAETIGYSQKIINALMFMCTTIAIVVGVKLVGAILIIALAVIPASIAKMWTNSLWSMTLLSAFIGMISCGLSCYIVVSIGKVPTGPVVVIVLFCLFTLSLIFSPKGLYKKIIYLK